MEHIIGSGFRGLDIFEGPLMAYEKVFAYSSNCRCFQHGVGQCHDSARLESFRSHILVDTPASIGTAPSIERLLSV